MTALIDPEDYNFQDAERDTQLRVKPPIQFIPHRKVIEERKDSVKIDVTATSRRQVSLFTPGEAESYVNFMRVQDSLLYAKKIHQLASKEETLYRAEEARGAAADADILSNIAESYQKYWQDAFEMMHNCLSSEAVGDWERCKLASIKSLSAVADELGKGFCLNAYNATRQTHRLIFIPKNGAALERTYLRNYIKKPKKMRIRTCALRLQEINAMLPYLPSDHGGTKQNVALDDTELCSILLRMIPRAMENAFWIQSNDVICSDWTMLVEKLEQIEQSNTLVDASGNTKGNGQATRRA
jgi:hypothetical protein